MAKSCPLSRAYDGGSCGQLCSTDHSGHGSDTPSRRECLTMRCCDRTTAMGPSLAGRECEAVRGWVGGYYVSAWALPSSTLEPK